MTPDVDTSREPKWFLTSFVPPSVARWLGRPADSHSYSQIKDGRYKEYDTQNPPAPFFQHATASKIIQWLLGSVFPFLLPSFISARYHRTSNQSSHKIAPTSWLDGLRGIACFIVFVYHYFYAYFETRGFTFDFTNEESGNRYFMQLPMIRILHSGRSMVSIFFVISGFALSHKVVMLMRSVKMQSAAERSHAILSNLASSVWRRHLRLFLPLIGTYLLVAVFVAAGWFEAVPWGENGWLKGNVEFRPARESGLWSQLVSAAREYVKVAGPVTLFHGWVYPDYMSVYDSHLWTIPEEFHQSMLLFLVMLGLSHMKRWVRVYIFLPVFVVASLLNGYWAMSLFIFGFLMAEVHAEVVAARETVLSPKLPGGGYSPVHDTALERRGHERLKRVVAAIALAAGVYLCCFPDAPPDENSTTGFTTLSKWAPQQYGGEAACGFWMHVGADILVFSIVFLPAVQNILCWRIFQYFGRISFALYLVHGTTNRSLGHALVHWGWRVTGANALWAEAPVESATLERARIAVVFAVFLVDVPVTIWMADIFWRVFDMPSVRYVRWLEGKLARA
ncbi:hypothetical protein Dda_2633 [Drechslerella dactyloides]|uniref:Acyltransferase 3 domain-containing protein n=1 Tax=Drechslerella dactyloides TaxID=74499 RepID=A0AAD6NKG9_DREDA|nr:hypothetical protein Dda_2633 [Drechslerella dactyloides]